MGLLQKAYETYENQSYWAGRPREGRPTLLPVSHITQKAQIEITLDRDGRFVRAREVPKEDQRTVIPATEDSGGRAGKVISPHPLSDQLDYLVPYSGDKYDAYLNGLSAWASSLHSHPKVRAVEAYIRSEAILSDLAAAGLLTLNADGTPAMGKVAGTDYEKCLVRWVVLGTGEIDPCWEDPTLFEAYIQYYANRLAEAEQGLCMISGKWQSIAGNHPKGILATSYGAKLISANDSSGFTYRGRFREPWQAATVGYLTSQKAHSALQWVAADKHSCVVIGGRAFLCWNPKGIQVPSPVIPFQFAQEAAPAAPSDYKRELNLAIRGYRNALPDREDVILAIFDAATTGRLSLTYYNELKASDFFARVEEWYSTCCWENGPYGVQSPPLRRIAERAFGVERSSGLIELDDRVLKEQVQRLLSCVVDGASVPYDIVKALVQRASTPLAYTKSNRAAVLFTACALIRKYYNDKHNKEEWTMAFDPTRLDRSYQFGALLAVLERAETKTYNLDEKREPNAIRMQSVFCSRPLHTAKLLNDRLQPYFQRLKRDHTANYVMYKKRIGEIMEILDQLSQAGERLNAPLKDTYLLGYYLQRKDLYTPRKTDDTQKEEN